MEMNPYALYQPNSRPPTMEDITASVDALVDKVMRPDDGDTYPDGTPRIAGLLTMGEARQMWYLEHLKRDRSTVPVDTAMADDGDTLVYTDHGGVERTRQYPPDPYRTLPFTAPVHMPNGSIERWGVRKLKQAGALLFGNLPWEVEHFKADLHYNKNTGRINVVHGDNFDQKGYDDWLRHT